MSAPAEVRDRRSLTGKHPGTGTFNTWPETWATMFRDYMAGEESLAEVARRYRVRYSAAHGRAIHERWELIRRMLREPDARELYHWQTADYLGERVHRRAESMSRYLLHALSCLPPPDPKPYEGEPDYDTAGPVTGTYRDLLH